MKIVQIHLWMQNKRKTWIEQEVTRYNKRTKKDEPIPGKRVVIIPSGQTVVQIKMDVAKELEKWMPELGSYYVVAVAEKSDGSLGYRTVVRKVTV